MTDGKPAPPARPGRLPVKKLLLVLGAVATAYAAVLLIWGGTGATAAAPLDLLWSWTGLEAACLCLLNYLLRGLRWRLWMQHYGRRFGLAQGLRLYLAGYAFTPTPGNVGEAVRGLMLRHEPLGTAQSLAIFGAERIADLVCLLLLCLPVGLWLTGFIADAGWFANRQAWWLWAAFAAAVVILIMALVIRPYLSRWAQRLGWLREAGRCLTVRPALWLGMTLAAWAAQGVALWLLCRDAGVAVGLLTAMGFYALAMVVGALSALPAGLGGMEASLVTLLVAQGASGSAALTITVLTRLLTLWLAVAIGIAALLYSAAIKKDISFS